mmetsp:Transcript_1431/g.5422  ORF Transcript_1431/g.5422 Transcript_1431/m.5422 type:complete len:247 (-) Transcript_1431:106-846(-)
MRPISNDEQPDHSVHQEGGDQHVVHSIYGRLSLIQSKVLLDLPAVSRGLKPLVGKGVNNAEAGEDLLGHSVSHGKGVLDLDGIFPEPNAVDPVARRDQRDRGARHQREPPVRVEEREPDAEDPGHRLDREPEDPRHIVGQGGDVGGEPAGQLTRRGHVEEADLLAQELIEESEPQAFDHPTFREGEQVHAPEVQHRVDGPGHRHDLDREPHLVRVLHGELGKHPGLQVGHSDAEGHPNKEDRAPHK